MTVGTIPVGGMSRSAAVDKIEKESGALYEGQNVSVTIYETTYDIPVEDVLQSVDSEQSAANAFAVGRTGNPFVRMWNVIKAAARSERGADRSDRGRGRADAGARGDRLQGADRAGRTDLGDRHGHP